MVSIYKKTPKCQECHQTHKGAQLQSLRGIIQCRSVLSRGTQSTTNIRVFPKRWEHWKLFILPALSLLYSKPSSHAALYPRSGAWTIYSALAQHVRQCSVVPVSGTSKGYLTTNKCCKPLVCGSQRTNNDRKQKFVVIRREAKQAARGRKRSHHTSRAPCSSGWPAQTQLIARDTICVGTNHLLT